MIRNLKNKIKTYTCALFGYESTRTNVYINTSLVWGSLSLN